MVDYKNAFKKPFMDVKILLIGLSLTTASFLLPTASFGNALLENAISLVAFIIGLLVTGYYALVASETLHKRRFMPEWADWRNLFYKGAVVTILTFIYFIPLIILLVIFLGPSISNLQQQLDLSKVSSFGIAIIMATGTLLSYIMPSAIMGYIKHDKIISAFRYGEIFRKSFTKSYLLAWIISIAYLMLVMLASNYIPYVGAPISNFIVGVTVMSIIADAYNE